MKKFILIVILFSGLVSCGTLQPTDTKLEQEEDSLIANDIEKCKILNGREKDECIDKLVEDYILVFKARPKLIRETLVDVGADWVRVRKTFQKHKLYIRFDEVQKRKAFIDKVQDTLGTIGSYATTLLLGVLVGVFLF